tara:strand:+ start:4394 stop:4948 length:555 start_codon:yes stop_codon:yes gene_type:complete
MKGINNMNNDLIEATDNFDRDFLLNNENILFSNMEFFEKLFLYLIENKKNKTIIFIFKHFENKIPVRIFNVALYHSLTKKNNAIFQYYYKYQIKYIQEDYDLILSLSTEHGLTENVKKLLFLDEFNFEKNAETPFLKAIYNEYTDIIRIFLLHRNKETNDYLKSNKYARKKVDFILLKYSIESF